MYVSLKETLCPFSNIETELQDARKRPHQALDLT